MQEQFAASTTPVEHSYDFPLHVRYGEVGADGVVTLSALANWLQEAAGQSASTLGFGEETLSAMGLTWILTRLVLRIRRLPASGEAIRVHTWPSTLDRFGYRGYEVFDASDALIVSGGSAWSIMDLQARKLSPVPPELAAVYPKNPRPCDAFTCRALPRLADDGDARAALRVRRNDLDINGHVNNAHYLCWLMEPFISPPTHPLVPGLIDLTFRSECFPGEELLSLGGAMKTDGDTRGIPEAFGVPLPYSMAHAIRRVGDPTSKDAKDDVCRAVTFWAEAPLA